MALPAAGIRSPTDVTAERLGSVVGVSAARAERLVSSFAAAADTYAVVELLVPAGLPARLAGSAVTRHGSRAFSVLAEDPWRVLGLDGVRVGEADRLARSLLEATGAGWGPARRDDPRRGRALVEHVLARAARDGHTALAAETVRAAVVGEGGGDPAAAVTAALAAERVQSARVVPDDGTAIGELLALTRYATAEAAIADGVARLLASAEPLDGPSEAAGADDLDEAQRSAVERVLDHGVSVLTGGPGTGKSRTVATVVRLAERRGRRIALAAPTGRAAKRLEELTGAPASTLHRLLGASVASGGFARDSTWPLDADVVVVDEASMLDVELAAALVEACADGTHLLFVGDPAQLPSIGPGRVLGDLVDSGAVLVTELATLYRQAEGGAIARLATSIRGGTLPPVDDPHREVVLVRAGGAAEAAYRTVQLVTDSIPRALSIPPEDVQVVTPVHRGPAGTVALNSALKEHLNPGPGATGGFDIGDRVVATANHLEDGFANGEVGVVLAEKDASLVVAFAGGTVTVPARALGDLRHGWAVTVHRAQGSEWPAVVAVFPGEAGGLLSRPLVYTGVTRARRHLSIVHAAGPALARAVRDVGARPRRTRLLGLVRAATASTSRPSGKV